MLFSSLIWFSFKIFRVSASSISLPKYEDVYKRQAYEKSKDLNILINDLFELTKLQNNSLPLNKIDINLVELVSQVISYLNYQLN